MSFGFRITDWATRRHRLVTVLMLSATVAVVLASGLPSIRPEAFPFLNGVRVDTDPENMLSPEEPARVLHDRLKKELTLHDMVVVGVVNGENEDGVFNPETLRKVHDLTAFARTLRWKGKAGAEVGVVVDDLIAPSTVDSIEQGGLGTVKFEWLMPQPPKTPEEARSVRDRAARLPFLQGTLVSEDGKALALYVPITSKDLSYRIASELRGKIRTFGGPERWYITGLPVAEDTFGVEMFVQMGISAPLAMLVIFLLMLLFFRKVVLILSPMILAMVTVIVTMGLLVIAGYPIHIMSSMIPIFLMPIAVLDSIHILSEFFERYQATRDRKKTILSVMDHLFVPMLYTSLTSAAGFASLALTPIPPVQVFGVFVAIGIMLAWLGTVTFIPAFVMFLRPETLERFGAVHGAAAGGGADSSPLLSRALLALGRRTFRHARVILALSLVVLAVAAWGITRIEINDNPVKWFTPSHPIRVADRVLNRHFGGTYMAYLALEAEAGSFDAGRAAREIAERARARGEELREDLPGAPAVFESLGKLAEGAARGPGGRAVPARAALLEALAREVSRRLEEAADGDAADAWDEASLFVDEQRQRSETFKDPRVLAYIRDLQGALASTDAVGKSNSLADLVRTVHRELFLGKDKEFRIPETRAAVAQCLLTYQSSHRAGDLWHFVTPDYRTSSIWVQLKSGDNKDMSRVVEAIEGFIAATPPPVPLRHEWFGLTYINVVWQKKMVSGMLQAFLGSFLVVFLLMALLFRSPLWGLLSMVPLTVTIAAIYGAIGIIGKAYDMPVAVLSSLSLGLAVDFAIHFLARSRRSQAETGSWDKTLPAVFGEPARAIARNIIVIAVGFLPLLFAPLMPYKTVGVLLATILLVSGVATLLLLPALMRVLEGRLFPRKPLGGPSS